MMRDFEAISGKFIAVGIYININIYIYIYYNCDLAPHKILHM
jgi:hypothetical protein